MRPNRIKKNRKFIFPKSTGILFVVCFAVLAYIITLETISINIIQYTKPAKTLYIAVPDGTNKKKLVRFNLPVKSVFPIDTVKQGKTEYRVAGVQSNILFNQNPAFMVWAFLVCSMMSIAAGSVPFFISQIIELKKKFSLSRRKVWVGGILYALLLDFFLFRTNSNTLGYFTPPDIIDHFHILFTKGSIINCLVGAILFLILPGLAVMFLIGASSDSIYLVAKDKVADENENSMESIEDATKKIKYLNQLLQTALQILSVVVVFSVLTTSMLGQSIRSTISVQGLDLYPKQISYVYGMYFALFLCVIYVPIYYYLKNNYNRLKELAAKPGNIPDSAEWYKTLFGDSKFEGSAIENFKLSLTIIAPIITSFLPNTFEFLK